jgi:hypothetical protein
MLSTGLFFFICACGDDQRRQEVVDDVRVLGVKTSGAVSVTGTPGPVSLEVFALAPAGKSVNFAPSQDTGAQRTRNPVGIAMSGAVATTTLGDFTLYSQNASVALPATAAGLVPSNLSGDFVFRYSFLVNGGASPIQAVGDLFWLADPASSSLGFSAPSIQLNSPSSGQKLQSGEEVSLEATVMGGTQEELRVSWYVAGGEVVNFRAAETVWTPSAEDKGKSVPVLVTVRGLTTRSLDIKWVVVDVE